MDLKDFSYATPKMVVAGGQIHVRQRDASSPKRVDFRPKHENIAAMTDDEIKSHLRIKYIPAGGGFDTRDIAAYDQFLGLSRVEQVVRLATMDMLDYELYLQLMTSREEYQSSQGRSLGSFTSNEPRARR